MTAEELKSRFKKFAIRIVRMVDNLPNTLSGKVIGNQIVRSGTSPGANYRAACIAKSDRDFVNKLKMVEEELDETIYWLDLITEAELLKSELLIDLKKEAKELLSIITSSILTKKNKMKLK